mmetsp:Transcript_91411/g.161909  ORF Transcript_91411/g.161909 Transcript_91411/m.161909 type:complete len:201 (+) Transcript_91411:1431-2033(+)
MKTDEAVVLESRTTRSSQTVVRTPNSQSIGSFGGTTQVILNAALRAFSSSETDSRSGAVTLETSTVAFICINAASSRSYSPSASPASSASPAKPLVDSCASSLASRLRGTGGDCGPAGPLPKAEASPCGVTSASPAVTAACSVAVRLFAPAISSTCRNDVPKFCSIASLSAVASSDSAVPLATSSIGVPSAISSRCAPAS